MDERAAARHKTVGAILQELVRKGRIRREAEGRYRLVASQKEKAVPAANGSSRGVGRFPVPDAHAQGFEAEPLSGTVP